jgi:hypothetical protein
MSGRLPESKPVKKGEVMPLHPMSALARMEMERPMMEEPAARIRAVYLDKKPMPESTRDPAGDASDVRHRILAASLFPSLYNRKTLVEHG